MTILVSDNDGPHIVYDMHAYLHCCIFKPHGIVLRNLMQESFQVGLQEVDSSDHDAQYVYINKLQGYN